MKHGEMSPPPRVSLERRLIERRVHVHDVEEDAENDAREHSEEVTESESSQDEIRRRRDHIGPREHDYVEQIRRYAEKAHERRQPAVNRPIGVRELPVDRQLVRRVHHQIDAVRHVVSR